MIKILDIISTKIYRNIIFYVLFTVILTVTLASQNYFFQKIIENGFSKRDIIAQKDIKVIDTRKTELYRKEVAQNIEPILIQAENDFIINSLKSLQTSIMKIKTSNISNNEKRDELKILFDNGETLGLIDFILKADTNIMMSIFDKTEVTLVSVLNTGVSAKDIETNNVEKLIKKNLPLNIPRYQANIITEILKQIIVPNLVIDELATEIAKKNAQEAVKPYEVIFKKGQYIVNKDTYVTKLEKDALRQAGYNLLEINWGGIIGLYFLVSLLTIVFMLYEKNFEKQYFNNKYLCITASFTLILSFLCALLPTGFSPYIIPIPAYTILLSIFTTPRNAFFASTIALGIISLSMHWSLEVIVTYMLLNTIVMTSVSKLKFSKRTDLLITSSQIALAGILILSSVYFLEKFMMDIDNFHIYKDLCFLTINCIVFSGIFLLGLLPIIENVFGVLTPYGLAEWADHNQPLLKKLMQDAPGTFNHSLTVSHLCENAAEAIGANPVLARVGAMYHDIGKLMRAMFFVENQSFLGIENPHNTCTPRFSKMLITAHTKDGLEYAKEYHLPAIINNFILQHHGTGLVSYFYNEALKEEGVENVKEEQFRYTGPNPNMKETGILMLADAVESAVRAAKNPSNEEIDAIIQKIIKERLNDNQLVDCPLTLKDLNVIAETFSKLLRGMYHKRIKYHNDLVQELDNKNQEILSTGLDKDLESKIKELESKKHDKS